MKTITSVTAFQDAIGMRLSMTYSEIDEKGQVISDNGREDRVITDSAAKKAAKSLMDYAQEIIDTEE